MRAVSALAAMYRSVRQSPWACRAEIRANPWGNDDACAWDAAGIHWRNPLEGKTDSMGTFESLSQALAGRFDADLVHLPGGLRQRIEREFQPMAWADLSAEQRRSVAAQLDHHDDPATEPLRAFWWGFFDRKRSLEGQVAEWQAATAPTAGELALRESRLAELRRELAHMDEQLRRDAAGSQPAPRAPHANTSGTAVGSTFGLPVGVEDTSGTGPGQVASTLQEPCVQASPVLGSAEWRSKNARNAAHAKHSKPGGSHEKRRAIRDYWASGSYSSRDRCAEQECAALDMAHSTARRALSGTPDPDRCQVRPGRC